VTRAAARRRLERPVGGADEAHRQRRAAGREVVAEQAQLGRPAGREGEDVRIAVVIEVEDGEASAVHVEVEAQGTGDVVEAAPAVVAQEYVAVVPGERTIGHQPALRTPGGVVRGARRLGEGRPRHHAAPEQRVEVDVALLAGDHPVHAVEVFPAVAVEVEGTRGPGPAAHLGAGGDRDVFEGAVAAVAEQRVAAGVVMVERPYPLRRVAHEVGARRHPETVVAPHLPAVDVEPAVAVVVEPEDAHAGRVVLDAGPGRDVLEAHLAVPQTHVVVEVLPPEVVGDDQVGPPVAVVVAPGGGEAEAVVARFQPRLVGHVDEPSVAVVAEEHVGRAVRRVVVGRGRARLPLADTVVEGVHAQVQVEEPVAVVVADRHPHGRTLQGAGEPEGVRVPREAAGPVVAEEDQSRGTRAEREDEVLVAVVVDVGEERVLRVLQDAEPGALRHVLEGTVAAGPVQPVGKPVRLADVHVLPPVPVDVGDRDAVVAARVARERRIERLPPVVEADTELPTERVDRAEGGGRHLIEDGHRSAAAGVAQGRPLDDAPAGGSVLPAHPPPADALDAVGRAAGTHQVVAHLGAG
jgi:hypothetical protein